MIIAWGLYYSQESFVDDQTQREPLFLCSSKLLILRNAGWCEKRTRLCVSGTTYLCALKAEVMDPQGGAL